MTHPTQSRIKETLLRLGAIRKENIEVFSEHTRDREGLTVFRDRMSGVIFIDDYYVGEHEYVSGRYRQEPKTPVAVPDHEDVTDSERRVRTCRQFITAKSVVDFGCGAGSFLKLARSCAARVAGVELQQDYVESLKHEGIDCRSDMSLVDDDQDTIFLFHCLEHLPDPTSILKAIRGKLKAGGRGRIVVEVPHARDFLLDKLELQSFKDFTLWSQHLVLHTRESLTLLLVDAGFRNVHIEGVQRYGLANHLHWLNHDRPGGHKESLSILETRNLVDAYADALSKIDANDTLVAVAET